MTYSALDVAKYVIFWYNENEKIISNLKLQKILYFIQAEFLVSKGESCFREDILALDFGPVVMEVYMKYRFFGAGTIPISSTELCNIPGASKKDLSLIENIAAQCSEYSNVGLTKLSISQAPWIYAYNRNGVITLNSLKKYFGWQT